MIKTENHFYVYDADVYQPDELDALISSGELSWNEMRDYARDNFGSRGHKYFNGDGLVIGYRAHTSNTATFGGDVYETITVWSQSGDIPDGEQVLIDDNLRVFAHRFNPSASAYSVGEIHDGWVEIKTTYAGMQVSIMGSYYPQIQGLEKRGPGRAMIKKEFTAKRIYLPRASRWYAR